MKKFSRSIIRALFVMAALMFSFYSIHAAANEWSWPLGKPYSGRYEEGQQFGNTSFNRGGGRYFHDGFDFGSAIYGNGNIYAVHDGKILYAGWDPVGGGSLGAFIVLQAGNTNVIYQEFSRNIRDVRVTTGQTVRKGQVIGNFTSSHLHLGMTRKEWRSAHSSAFKNDGTWFNPIPVLQGASTSGAVSPKPTSKNFTTNVHYALHTLGGSWLPEVTNFDGTDNGYAGYPNRQHDLLYVKVDKGQLRYRVHTAKSGWLPWVNKGDKNDIVDGVAGIPGQAIDGVQLDYTTPSGEKLSQAYYRSQTTKRAGWLKVSADNGSIPGLDSFAGMFGEPLDRLQIGISQSNPF